MDINFLIGAIVVVAVVGYFIWKKFGTLDANHDGKVDAADAKVIAEAAVVETKQVVEEVKAKVKSAPAKKTPAKKTAGAKKAGGRKPKSKA